MKKYFLRLLILSFLFGISKLNASDTSPQYINGNDTLVVYKSIPNLPEFMPRVEASEKQDIRTFSNKFTIRVRSAATNNEWVDVLALYTYNRAVEILDLNMLSGGKAGTNSATSVQNYPNATAGWSHTYGNIEMSRNQPVEVEISLKPGVKIDGQDIYKATVHPAQKAGAATVTNGKVYFTISNPAQVAIDINGQMDDHNPFNGSPIGTPTDGVSTYTVPLHTITFFANPVIKKPALNDSRTFYVVGGKMPAVSPSTYDVLYFMPGVHDIGLNNKIYPGKSVYIPGDAIIFGSLNNDGVPLGSFSKMGEKIKIYGYGTISGARIKHPDYVTNPGIHEPININGALNYQVNGITIADGAHFSLWTPSGSGGFVSYVKVIGWRANGDGLGNGDNVNDCFVRTNDDASYVRGNRKRVTYWKDNISAIFYMAAIWTTPILIEDCDILYCRARGGGGAAWDMRADQTPGVKSTQTIFRNIRFHDPIANMTIFNLVTYKGTAASPTEVGQSYNWIKFENISIKSSTVKSNLLGCAAAPWNGGLTFDNVTFGGVLLTQQNFKTYFNTNEFVKDLVFKGLINHTILLNVNGGVGGSVAGGGTFNQGLSILVTATPSIGYQFVNWTENGVQQSNNDTIIFVVDKSRTLTANFTNTPQSPVVDFTSNTNSITPGSTVNYTDITTFNPTSWLWTFTGGSPATSAAQNPTVTYPATGAYSVTLTATNSVGSGTLTKTSFVNVAPIPIGETLPWNESFTLPNGTNSNVAPTSWTATNMSVQNNEMSFNYVGEGVFKTGAIDISSGPVTVSVKIRGGSGLDVGQDYLKLYKKVDGGAEEEIGFANGPVTVFSFTANISSGTKLELILRARVSSASEYYYFDDINVNSVSPVYQLSISANPTIGGTTSGGGTFNSGQITTITASPSTGYKFVNWTENGLSVSTNPAYTYTISASRTLVANFSVNTNVSQELDNLTFNVYPNPATDIINIDFNDIGMNKEIKLINNLGQVVYSNITKEKTVLVNLKTLNIRGLVLVQVMTGKNLYYKKLLVR